MRMGASWKFLTSTLRRAKAKLLSARLALACLALMVALMPSMAARPQAQTGETGVPSLLLGAAWYPEQWPESRWEKDLQLMQDAHLHVVRVGEFA